MEIKTSIQEGKETLTQEEQNDITIQEIQFDLEEIRKLQEADRQFPKLIKKMKLKMK